MTDDTLQGADDLLEESPIGAEEAAELAKGYDHDDVNSLVQECYDKAGEALDGDLYDETEQVLDAADKFTDALEMYESGEDVSDRDLATMTSVANNAVGYISELASKTNDKFAFGQKRRLDRDKEDPETNHRQYVETLSDIEETLVEDVVVPGTMRTLTVADLDEQDIEEFEDGVIDAFQTYNVSTNLG